MTGASHEARCALVLLGVLAAGCGHTDAQRRANALPSVTALRDGRFEEAADRSQKVIADDPGNSRARAVLALTRYKSAGHQFMLDVTSAFAGAALGGINHKYLRQAGTDFERELGLVDADLAAAARDPRFELELCLACWKVDWNRNGRIDSRDEKLFQIELDERGQEIPDGDPRRSPTFRFDVGDLHWARAMVAFQRAALDVLLAYRFTDVDRLIVSLVHLPRDFVLTLPLEHRERIADAKSRLLVGLAEADLARRAYLAETDDDREWVPNPRQKSHPLPLPVDERLYVTWEQVVEDVRRLVASEEGVDVTEAAQLGEHQWKQPPGGFLDFGRLLSDPKDIVIEFAALEASRDQPEETLRRVFGAAYVTSMKRSPLLERLDRMKREVKRGEEGLERKMRYLLWLN